MCLVLALQSGDGIFEFGRCHGVVVFVLDAGLACNILMPVGGACGTEFAE